MWMKPAPTGPPPSRMPSSRCSRITVLRSSTGAGGPQRRATPPSRPRSTCCGSRTEPRSTATWPTLAGTRRSTSSARCSPTSGPCGSTPSSAQARSGPDGSAGPGGFAVGAGQDDGVAVGVAEPDLTVGGAAGPVGRVAVGRADDLGSQLVGPGDGGVEVVDLEPQQHPVAVGPGVRIADRPVVVVDLEVVD